MVIREYTKDDELAWLRCRVLSFLDCSYSNDVLTRRESYENDAICLVAEENGKSKEKSPCFKSCRLC